MVDKNKTPRSANCEGLVNQTIQPANYSASPISNVLSRLEKVRRTGPDRWSAACPAHEDKTPSLAVRELNDGRILLHCFGGCSADDVLSALGLEFQNLYPERLGERMPPERRPFPASDALRALDDDLLLVLFCIDHIASGQVVSPETRQKLILSGNRIHSARAACGVAA